MKIYVSAKWEDQERAREVMLQLIEAGHTITYDWTVQLQESGEQAEKDICGVIAADAFVGIFEKDLKYVGALMEFGAALAMGVPVYVIGTAPITNHMFFKHDLVHWGIGPLLRDAS